MIHSDGHVRLIDLGLAALVQPPRFHSTTAGIDSTGAAQGPIESHQEIPAVGSGLVALLQVTHLQSLIPAPRNDVVRRLREGVGSSLSFQSSALRSVTQTAALPGTAGPLFGVIGSVLLCVVHESDLRGPLATSDEVQDLHTALQLCGLFVTTAATVMRAIELLRRDVAPRIYDVVVIVATPRTLDGALNLIYEVNALPLEVSTCGRAGTPRRFAAFVCAEGIPFDTCSNSLRDAGAFVIGRMPAAPSTLRAIADTFSTDVEGVATSALPSPVIIGDDAEAGFSPGFSPFCQNRVHPVVDSQTRPVGDAEDAFDVHHAAHEDKKQSVARGSQTADVGTDCEESNRPANPLTRGLPVGRSKPMSVTRHRLPELASLTVAGVLKVRFVSNESCSTTPINLAPQCVFRKPSPVSQGPHRIVSVDE